MRAFFQRVATALELPRARWLIFAGAACVFIAFFPTLRFLRSGTMMDYGVWFNAGAAVGRGEVVYPNNGSFPFMYPPVCADFLALPAALGKAGLIFALSLINAGAWLLSNWLLLRLVRGKFALASAIMANFLLLVFLWSNAHLGQPSLVLLALMLGGLVCLQRGRAGAAGGLFAVAVALKAFPILVLPYLIFRRQWLASLTLVVAVATLFFVVPIPLRGNARNLDDLQRWSGGMLRYQETGVAQRAARSYSWKNQSLIAVANRFLRHVSADEGRAVFVNVANVDFRITNSAIIAVAIALGLAFVLALPRARTPAKDALEFSALLILMLICTPLAFGYLFVWLLVPMTALLQRILAARAPRTLFVIGLICLLATGIAPRYAQIYGSLFLAALAFYFAALRELKGAAANRAREMQ
ncbi:MAG: DUF2029 domain-containing protein [Verrucomicrobiota bacterium]|nr:DUF2029 domain-containing protein [Verrucomicrobiota bacterium]